MQLKLENKKEKKEFEIKEFEKKNFKKRIWNRTCAKIEKFCNDFDSKFFFPRLSEIKKTKIECFWKNFLRIWLHFQNVAASPAHATCVKKDNIH